MFVVFVFVGFYVYQSMVAFVPSASAPVLAYNLLLIPDQAKLHMYTTTPTTQRFRCVMRCLSEWRRQLITAKSMASARAESSQKSEKVLAAHILDGWKAVVDRNNLHKWLFGRLMARYSVQYVLLVCHM
jgi:hypothetical protein